MDPLPEERASVTSSITNTTPTTTTIASNEPYKRVYPDWKPSVLERVELNVDENHSIDDLTSPAKHEKLRNSASSTSISSMTTPLQSIIEEDRRINENSLKVNVRRASELNDYEPVYQKQCNNSNNSPVGIISDSHSIQIRPSISSSTKFDNLSTTKCHSFDDSNAHEPAASNKIEIDSDNIETPPVIRKNLNVSSDDKSLNSTTSTKKLQAPRPLHQRTIDESNAKENDDGQLLDSESALGNGNFDRHSSARRTRRYRRPTDHSSGNDERNDTTPESISPTNYPISSTRYCSDLDLSTKNTNNNDEDVDNDDNEIAIGANDSLSKSKSIDILSRIGRHGRNMSSINQEAVREAIRKLKSPTETPERIWSPPREILVTPKVLTAKVANHELNDEGFEETQSLVSDTPSHGKDSTSSCNDAGDTKQTRSTASDGTKGKSSVKSLLERNRQSLARSRSLRASTTVTPQSRNSIIPKRTNSLRRNVDTSAIASNRQDVERSGSRTSLRSSRSSLNSSASINTVRNMTSKSMASTPTASTTNRHSSNPVTDKTNLRKKLSSTPKQQQQQSKANGNSSFSYLKTPASRSSSSGSSIGPSSRQSYKNTSSSSITPPISPQRPAFRNSVSLSHGSTLSNPMGKSNSKLTNLKGIASKTSNRVSSFMRPTTSSATKVHTNRSK